MVPVIAIQLQICLHILNAFVTPCVETKFFGVCLLSFICNVRVNIHCHIYQVVKGFHGQEFLYLFYLLNLTNLTNNLGESLNVNLIWIAKFTHHTHFTINLLIIDNHCSVWSWKELTVSTISFTFDLFLFYFFNRMRNCDCEKNVHKSTIRLYDEWN